MARASWAGESKVSAESTASHPQKNTHRGVLRPPFASFSEESTPKTNRHMQHQICRIASPRQNELLHSLSGDKKDSGPERSQPRKPPSQETRTFDNIPFPSTRDQLPTPMIDDAISGGSSSSSNKERPPYSRRAIRATKLSKGLTHQVPPDLSSRRKKNHKEHRIQQYPVCLSRIQEGRMPRASAELPYIDLPQTYCEAAIRIREKFERRVYSTCNPKTARKNL